MSNTSAKQPAIPTATTLTPPVPIPPATVDGLLTDAFFAPLRVILETANITRQCLTLDDLSFATLSVLRALQASANGRDFLQTHAIPLVPELTRSNYFASLSSPRRLAMMQALARHLRTNQLPNLRAQDDLLAVFPELKGWEVWAADGHKIAHATHDPRNDKDHYAPINAIYKLDLRTGYAEFLALAQPTARGVEHELTTLKRQAPAALRCGATKGQHTLLAYDRAVIDFQYAYELKQSKSIYLITRWKDNLAPVTASDRPIDRTNPANQLIISDETVVFKDTPGHWRKLTARAPDSDAIHILLTNEMTLPPGVLSECYRLRWRIEKVFDQQEQKLDERKAWAKSDTAKTIQAIAICLAHNLLQLFNANLKAEAAIEDTKVITAYHKDLDRREAKAKAAGRDFPKALYLALYRPTELSLQFLRWLRYHLMRATCYSPALALLRPLMTQYL